MNDITYIDLSVGHAISTYSGVFGPQVCQGKVVLVKVTLSYILHKRHVHSLHYLLFVETAPAEIKTGLDYIKL